MLIADAQQDLSRAYARGGPGVVISGLVWLVAAVTERERGIGAGFAALFVGGMFIFPVAKLVCRTILHRANEAAANPFGRMILEGTIAMIGGLFAAWLFLPSRPALVLPLAAVAVGTHYFGFATAYGNRAFWPLAAIVTATGLGDIFLPPMHGWTAPLVAAAELVFGAAVIRSATRDANPRL